MANLMFKKTPKQKIKNTYEQLISIDYFQNILNSLPFIVAVLNSKREVIYSNKVFLKLFNYDNIEQLLGFRYGEAIKCIHSDENLDGCGFSNNCKYCGVMKALKKSEDTLQPNKEECRVITKNNGTDEFYDFQVSIAPFLWNNETFILLSLEDISNEKRRKALESIFFHDVINKVGSLNGFLELMKETKDSNKFKGFINTAINISNDLTDEILAQRELLAAENNELKPNMMTLLSDEVVKAVVNHIQYNDVARERIIIIDPNLINISLTSDFILLKRVLTNMLKNALEAVRKKDIVTIGCNKSNDNIITFWVHNSTFIPKDIQLQIFERSFSTKGMNRGLGTYSIKLLTERYLNGKVFFKSSEKDGTFFYIELPIK